MEIFAWVVLGVAVFASTNLDDIFVLMLFFADKQFSTRHIVIGQYAGILLLILLSILASLMALVLPAHWLGILPIALGLKKLWDLRTDSTTQAEVLPVYEAGMGTRIFSVAAVTVANGGDNIGIYTPLFANSTPVQMGLLIVIFLLMTALWCGIGYWVIQRAGHTIQKLGQIVLPFVLIGLGLWILV